MAGEAIAMIGSVVTIGIGLAVLIVRSMARLDRRIDGLEHTLGRLIDGVEKGQAGLRERMAKLEGLREAIFGRRAA